MTGEQLRAARQLIGWTITRLAYRSGVPEGGIRIFENTGHLQTTTLADHKHEVAAHRVAALRRVLSRAGVEFASDDTPSLRVTIQGDPTAPSQAGQDTGSEIAQNSTGECVAKPQRPLFAGAQNRRFGSAGKPSIEEMAAWYRAGMSCAAIAKKASSRSGTVSVALRKHGVKMRPVGGPRHTWSYYPVNYY